VPENAGELGLHVKTRMLGIGGYAFVGYIVIERKTADDFVAGIFDGRLFKQASKSSSACSRTVLTAENPSHEALQSVSNRNPVYGALATTAFSHGFKVFQTSVGDDTAQLIATMARHGRYGDMRYTLPMVRASQALRRPGRGSEDREQMA